MVEYIGMCLTTVQNPAAEICLPKRGVTHVLLKRTTDSKLCSGAGAGVEMCQSVGTGRQLEQQEGCSLTGLVSAGSQSHGRHFTRGDTRTPLTDQDSASRNSIKAHRNSHEGEVDDTYLHQNDYTAARGRYLGDKMVSMVTISIAVFGG